MAGQPHTLHERAVEGHPFDRALFAELLDFRLGNPAPVVFLQRGNAFIGRDWLAAQAKRPLVMPASAMPTMPRTTPF